MLFIIWIIFYISADMFFWIYPVFNTSECARSINSKINLIDVIRKIAIQIQLHINAEIGHLLENISIVSSSEPVYWQHHMFAKVTDLKNNRLFKFIFKNSVKILNQNLSLTIVVEQQRYLNFFMYQSVLKWNINANNLADFSWFSGYNVRSPLLLQMNHDITKWNVKADR